MQSAHSFSNLVGSPFGSVVVVVPPPPLPLLVPALVLGGKLATVGELVPWLPGGELVPWLPGGELEPLHAASPIAAPARRATSPTHRRHVVVMSRFPPCAIQGAL